MQMFSVHRLAASGIYKNVMRKFPEQHLSFAFAYGSGVFQQQGHQDTSKNMLDFIFAVDHPEDWHKENIARNPSHYSFLKYFGAHHISHIQENFGAGAYFNTLVPCEGRLIKYGVISTFALKRDLLDWDNLYMSGRLHKPVLTLHRSSEHEEKLSLGSALVANLQSALHLSLLLLPDTFTEQELFTTITAISYAGDFRMTIGEDKNKISNIVKPNMSHFRELYSPIIEQYPEHVQWKKSLAVYEQSISTQSRFYHLNLLPKTLIDSLVGAVNADGRQRDTEDVLWNLASNSDSEEALHRATGAIVKKSSLSQSLKGILTAGIVKSVIYASQKLKKMYKSLQK